MGEQQVRAAVEEAVDEGLDLGVEVGVVGEGGVVEVADAGALGADGALAQETAQQGLDGGGAPGAGGPDLGDQIGGGERAAAPEGGQDLALGFGDVEAQGRTQGRSTARSMRASTAQLATVATAPESRPRAISRTISAKPGATSFSGGGVGALDRPMNRIRAV